MTLLITACFYVSYSVGDVLDCCWMASCQSIWSFDN